MKGIYLFFLFIMFKSVFAQPHIVSLHRNYLIYEKDTFNRINQYGELSGKGISLKVDTTIIVSGNYSYDCFWKNGQSHCTQILVDGDTVYQIQAQVLGIGEYKKNKKQGKWLYSSSKDLKKIDAEIDFNDGEICGPLVIYDESNKPKLKAVKNHDDWEIYEWSSTQNIFSLKNKIKSLSLYLETFNIN